MLTCFPTVAFPCQHSERFLFWGAWDEEFMIMWLFPKFLFILCLITLCVVHADITAVNLFVFKLSFFIEQWLISD